MQSKRLMRTGIVTGLFALVLLSSGQVLAERGRAEHRQGSDWGRFDHPRPGGGRGSGWTRDRDGGSKSGWTRDRGGNHGSAWGRDHDGDRWRHHGDRYDHGTRGYGYRDHGYHDNHWDHHYGHGYRHYYRDYDPWWVDPYPRIYSGILFGLWYPW